MPALLIRGLDDNFKRQLRLRAAENGHSMEEEARQILRRALEAPRPDEAPAPEPMASSEEEGHGAAVEAAAPRPSRFLRQRGGRVRLFSR